MRCWLLLVSLILLHVSGFTQDRIQRVRSFGKNKGHLKMYMHAPPNADNNKAAPLVLMLHGCTQCAERADKQTGWSKLADEEGFYVVYPQQRFWNNPEKCFRWYKRKHANKNRGENYYILQMVNYMKQHYRIDSSRVYITGLSAGAAMSVIMMADYPQVFNSGAIFAGGAYKSGNGLVTSVMAMAGWRVKSAEKWGKIVRKQNPDFKGSYPRMIIYQGNSDWVVNRRNGIELMKQWTDLHQVGQKPTETIDGFLNIPQIHRHVYGNNTVIFYKIDKMNHALPIDPGACKEQGGRRGIFSKDLNFNSTRWAAYDFGLIKTPEIDGPKESFLRQKVQFTVPQNIESTFEWTFPSDCTLISGKGSNSIVLEWGASSGCVNVRETDAKGCQTHYKTLFVTVRDLK